MINIHVLPDDKFSSGFVENCSKHNIVENKFFSVLPKDVEPRFAIENVEYLRSVDDILDTISGKDVRRIYLHSLGYFCAEVLRKIESTSPITWVLYGSGVYRRLPFYKLYEPRTRLLTYFGYDQMTPRNWTGFLAPRNWVRFSASTLRPLAKYWRTRYALRKLDSIAFWLRSDYKKIREFYSLDLDFIEFRYGSTPVSTNITPTASAGFASILLGNSADPTNNHVDALYNLRDAGFRGRIVCPLSYSGGGEYVNSVVSVGKQLFGNRFEPLRSYIPKANYFQLLSNIDAAYFYHRRQQAGANIGYFLLCGKPVFLHPHSPVLHYYYRLGVPLVYSVSEFRNGFGVSQDDAVETIRMLREQHSREEKYRRYHNLLTYGMLEDVYPGDII